MLVLVLCAVKQLKQLHHCVSVGVMCCEAVEVAPSLC